MSLVLCSDLRVHKGWRLLAIDSREVGELGAPWHLMKCMHVVKDRVVCWGIAVAYTENAYF